MIKQETNMTNDLITAYAKRIVQNMSVEDLVTLAYEVIEGNLKSYDTDELLAEVREFEPALLDMVGVH
jgi:hypothetical protein